MDSDSNCVVNFVEIIHDCVPRSVDLDLTFASHGTDNLYLEVKNVANCIYLIQVIFRVTAWFRAIESVGHLIS